ncbi:hypothetical protein BK727_07435 [Bacillus thuringiensis serovar roskildiensis]|uniref:Uncharacterized protein n=1 Tax=Bacillus thuringiensis serovar sooncheon TaxID=180891 RepID=A0A9Q5SL29_BACTU|nr:hypothetical protein [Bacillus thuringiensis]MEB9661037.1 hypothetical protein [Bacillus cereus]ARV91330.1 hypothetical protein BJG91_01330 [Bacillus thuringiensis]OTW70664.1 hypothetical protein BK707_11170 [Bacillus thuringiensis serovar coreanensis]OTX50975.1 hypothetical protein BK724_05200 [Bacillus thuringiensis serovar sooncheon]OTX56852.1 hypothetical protein BK725_08640 [Bacillus thuringiensis serovar guiyangiensis]
MSNLVLPSNYVEIENEEMEYVDGGYYINNSTLKGIVFSGVGASAGVSVVAIEAGIYGIAAAMASAVPALGWVTGAVLAANATNFALAATQAISRGKGIDVGVGFPTGLTFAVK